MKNLLEIKKEMNQDYQLLKEILDGIQDTSNRLGNLETLMGEKFVNQTESLLSIKKDLTNLTTRVTANEKLLEVYKAHDLPPRVTQLEKKWWWVMGAVAAAGSLGGTVAAVVAWVLQIIF